MLEQLKGLTISNLGTNKGRPLAITVLELSLYRFL